MLVQKEHTLIATVMGLHTPEGLVSGKDNSNVRDVVRKSNKLKKNHNITLLKANIRLKLSNGVDGGHVIYKTQ